MTDNDPEDIFFEEKNPFIGKTGSGNGLAALENATIMIKLFRINPEDIVEEAIEYAHALGSPHLTPIYGHLAYRHYEAGEYEEALLNYQLALEINPDDLDTYVNRGAVYEQLGRLEDAMADLNRAVELAPDSAYPYVNRGVVYERQSKFDQAIADYSRAIELAPELIQPYVNRGNTYVRLRQRTEAIADYTHVIESDGRSSHLSQAYGARGMTYYYVGQYENALADLTRVTELEPGNSELLPICKSIQTLINLNHTIQAEPENAEAYAMRGTIYFTTGREMDALVDIHKAAQLGISEVEEFTIVIWKALWLKSFEAFREATSYDEMQRIISEFPFMTDSNYIQRIKEMIKEKASPEQKSKLLERFGWLQQLVDEQNLI